MLLRFQTRCANKRISASHLNSDHCSCVTSSHCTIPRLIHSLLDRGSRRRAACSAMHTVVTLNQHQLTLTLAFNGGHWEIIKTPQTCFTPNFCFPDTSSWLSGDGMQRGPRKRGPRFFHHRAGPVTSMYNTPFCCFVCLVLYFCMGFINTIGVYCVVKKASGLP